MIDGDRTIAGFVFSVPSRHGKINELLKQLCNQFHICFKNETYKSYEKNITENGKCGLCFLLKVFPIYQFDSFYIIRHEHIKSQHNTTIILLFFCYFFYFFFTNLHIDINICNFIHVLFFSFLFILLKLLI
jgi:hypothetical protein